MLAIEAAELCVAVPVAICLIAPLGCLAGALFLGGLALAPVACVVAPLLCCSALCCCCAPQAGDESGPGLYSDRHPLFFTPYGPAVFTGVLDDGSEVFIVNSTIFTADAPRQLPGGTSAPRRSGVVITELPPDEGEPGGKSKTA